MDQSPSIRLECVGSSRDAAIRWASSARDLKVTQLRSPSLALIGAIAVAIAACAGDPASEGSQRDAVVIDTSVTQATRIVAEVAPAALAVAPITPRRPIDVELRMIWSSEPADDDSVFMLPNDIRFAPSGLLVFDAADRAIRVLDGATGALRFSVGREGDGPGELQARMRFLGPFDHPMLFDANARRLVRLNENGLVPEALRMTADRPWISMCALAPARTMGSVLGRAGYEFLMTESGELVDSIATPWPELAAQDFLMRQATVQQISDSSCALLTLYQHEFAVHYANGTTTRGEYPERLPRERANVTRDSAAKFPTHSVPRGTAAGPNHAAMWRNHVVLLFHGRTEQRDRLLDFYRGSDLAYVGSLVLPEHTRRIAVRGDTLAVIGEREDLPFVAVYHVRRSGAQRP